MIYRDFREIWEEYEWRRLNELLDGMECTPDEWKRLEEEWGRRGYRGGREDPTL